MPFPPVIFARSSACLIAETYISSHPASGMALISPPDTNAALQELGRLPTELSEFDYEPNFPIAVIATPDNLEHLQQHNRLSQHPSVDKLAVMDLEGQEALTKIELWLDEIGI